MPDEINDNAGHRDRLRARLIEGGPQALADYEIVELLLTLTLPRVDTKPIAKALLREFGSVAGIMAADQPAIVRIKGVGARGASAFAILQAAVLRVLHDKVVEKPILASWQSLLDYLRADLSRRTTECVRILHLDAKNGLIRDETMWEGTIDQAAVHTREVIRRAIDLGSASLILVHNHPSYPTSITHSHA